MPIPEELSHALTETYGPVEAVFTITQVPDGGAPEYIKREWVGVTMPVRTSRLGISALEACRYFDALTFTIIENPDPVSIVGVEAIEALRDSNKEEAADFWLPYGLAEFVFRAHEGDLAPVIEA